MKWAFCRILLLRAGMYYRRTYSNRECVKQESLAPLQHLVLCEETGLYLGARRTVANVEVVAFAAIHDEVHSARESGFS